MFGMVLITIGLGVALYYISKVAVEYGGKQ
ncbi:hypothetical protein QB910_000130 [Dabrowskivirus KKP3916]|uniref:Uncharacterized protein n=1 Tax=Alicyclobacillus phage KKP_3916 TaxID=3040651 RepID=A0AAT9V7R2_9CAUD|nr:hypothetical protein QB910_000130 [Alicyclobacillus phage KKP 3916]